MKVLCAMSGGVDSAVAAALLKEQGHEVVGVTMKLWGGESDTGCCSVSDVDDARRVAQQLDIDHLVFNFGDDFTASVVEPYIADHAAGRTPNPCIECNRSIKFDRLHARSRQLGFDAVATGHHAQVIEDAGVLRLARGADDAKDQSYVLYMLDQQALRESMFPVGSMTKDVVRQLAEDLGLRSASKPDSQDVCFISSRAGRGGFLDGRIGFTPADVVDEQGEVVGRVDAAELVTIGQRRGLGVGGSPTPRFVTQVDIKSARVKIGPAEDLETVEQSFRNVVWSDQPVEGEVEVQCSAHGEPTLAHLGDGFLRWASPRSRVAPGQSLVFYDGPAVLGGAIAS